MEASAITLASSTGYFVLQAPGGPDYPVLARHTTGAYGLDAGPDGPTRARTGLRWTVARIDSGGSASGSRD